MPQKPKVPFVYGYAMGGIVVIGGWGVLTEGRDSLCGPGSSDPFWRGFKE